MTRMLCQEFFKLYGIDLPPTNCADSKKKNSSYEMWQKWLWSFQSKWIFGLKIALVETTSVKIVLLETAVVKTEVVEYAIVESALSQTVIEETALGDTT